MTSSTVNYSFRVDREIKRQCETMFNELGMNMTTAINIFLRQSLRVGGLPFDVRVDLPNKETIAAMLEAERLAKDPTAKRYSDVDTALTALKE
jgi:DNA-damage-inducible protein J